MLKINNIANLPYKFIGEVIDKMQKQVITIYDGKEDMFTVTYNNTNYIVKVLYGAKNTTIVFKKARD